MFIESNYNDYDFDIFIKYRSIWDESWLVSCSNPEDIDEYETEILLDYDKQDYLLDAINEYLSKAYHGLVAGLYEIETGEDFGYGYIEISVSMEGDEVPTEEFCKRLALDIFNNVELIRTLDIKVTCYCTHTEVYPSSDWYEPDDYDITEYSECAEDSVPLKLATIGIYKNNKKVNSYEY